MVQKRRPGRYVISCAVGRSAGSHSAQLFYAK